MLVGLQSASGSWGGSPVSSCQHWLWTGDLSSCHCCGVLRLSCLSQSSQCRTPSSDSCHTPCCTHRQWPVYRHAQQRSKVPDCLTRLLLERSRDPLCHLGLTKHDLDYKGTRVPSQMILFKITQHHWSWILTLILTLWCCAPMICNLTNQRRYDSN